jgi:hypothetical protein
MLSERPAALNYELQGTKGSFESIRYEHIGGGKAYVKRPGESKPAWVDLHEIDEPYIPDIWRRMPASVLGPGGHGGSDYVMMTDFLDALADGRPSPLSIHRALDMTLPGLISQQSIARGGEWLEVPDSRTWLKQPDMAQ